MKKLFLVFILMVSPVVLLAMTPENRDKDSASVDSSMAIDSVRVTHFQKSLDGMSGSRLFRSTYLGVPLIVGGLIEKHQDSKFRKLRNDFMPRFHRDLDNYMQFAPAAVMVGLKAMGVPSRSSWGRIITSDAFSVAIFTGVVQGLKNSTHIMRRLG